MKVNSYLILLIAFTCNFIVSAQSERKITRKGNTQYETGNFVEAEINYKKAIEKNANLLEAQFNLGDALAKQERFEEAIASFDLVSATTDDDDLKASALHNKGNVLLQQQDLEGAVESYKEALRANPKDHQTRYNYAYAKKQLEQQQQQEQEQNDENKDEENKEDKEQDQENKEKGDQENEDSENKENKDEKNQDKKNDQKEEGENNDDKSDKEKQDKGETDGEDSDDEKNEKPVKPKENKLSPEEAQRLLEALKQEENKVQAKMKKHKIKGSKVKIEKDW